MEMPRRWRRRMRVLLDRRGVEREMEEEMRFHLEMEIEDRVRSLVLRNCRASCSNAGSPAWRSRIGTSRCARSGSATHDSTSRIRR